MPALKRISSWAILCLLIACKAPPEIKSGGVMSTSLCADAYVLELVPFADIKALSWQAGDKLSTAPKAFSTKPKARDDFETIISLKPDLVVFGAGEGKHTKPLLDKIGIKYINITWGEDFASIDKNIKTLQKQLPINTQKNEFQIPKQYLNPHNSSKKPKLLYISSSGAIAGKNTFIDAAFQAAGGENIIKKQGWFTPDPERLIDLKPDLIVTSFFNDGYTSISTNGLKNKIISDKINKTAHINIPGKLWPCAGPGLITATKLIETKISELE